MDSFFVSGTGTDVGKTFVSAAFILALQKKGLSVGYEKPAETGCKTLRGEPICADVEFIKSLTQCVTALPEYVFAPPRAPFIAAEEAGVSISMDTLIKRFKRRKAEVDSMVVEGAGGLLVPLTSRDSYADLICALEIPLLIAAEAGLGTINHTLLTIEAARSRKIQIVGIVFSSTSPRDSDLVQSNADEIQRISGIPVLGVLPYMSSPTRENLSACSQKINWP